MAMRRGTAGRNVGTNPFPFPLLLRLAAGDGAGPADVRATSAAASARMGFSVEGMPVGALGALGMGAGVGAMGVGAVGVLGGGGSVSSGLGMPACGMGGVHDGACAVGLCGRGQAGVVVPMCGWCGMQVGCTVLSQVCSNCTTWPCPHYVIGGCCGWCMLLLLHCTPTSAGVATGAPQNPDSTKLSTKSRHSCSSDRRMQVSMT